MPDKDIAQRAREAKEILEEGEKLARLLMKNQHALKELLDSAQPLDSGERNGRR